MQLQMFRPQPFAVVEPFLGTGATTAAALETHSPIPRFPGSKRDRADYPELYQFTATEAFVAEADPAVRCIWQCWLHERFHSDFYSQLQQLRQSFAEAYAQDVAIAEAVLIPIWEMFPQLWKLTSGQQQPGHQFWRWKSGFWDGACFSLLKTLRKSILKPMLTLWRKVMDYLKDELFHHVSKLWKQLKADFTNEMLTIPERAAVSLMLRKLTFGGVVRFGASGRLNIKYCLGQIEGIYFWRYQFPPAPAGEVHLFDSWEKAIAAYKASGLPGMIALDPPYYCPYAAGTKRRGNKSMDPAYPGHKPCESFTLAFAVDSFRMAIATQASHIFNYNYLSPALEDALLKLCPGLQKRRVGKLDGINQSGVKATNNEEYCWFVQRNLEEIAA